MNRFLALGLIPLAFAAPAAAQGMSNTAMPGMSMPMPSKAAPKATKTIHQKRPHKARKVATARRHGARAMAAIPGMASMAHAPGGGQDMASMPGMQKSAPTRSGANGMAAMPGVSGTPAAGAMADMPGMQKPGAGMAAMPGMSTAGPTGSKAAMGDMAGMKGMAPGAAATPGTAEPEIPNGPAPPPPSDHAADRFYDPVAMAAARAGLRQEHGGTSTSKVMANLAEYQARTRGGAGYRWDGQAWFGGDIDRFVVKSEGEGSRRGGLDSAELQGLFSHAIGPYFNLEGGLRQDFKPRSRTYATVAVEGLAPYWFDVGGALFLSNKGEVLGRAEATYDLRLSQRLILQPRVELNLAAQDTRETRTGAGLSNAEFGLRLRYEITREFAPYVGVSYDRKVGKTASYARAFGDNPEATSLVFGIRAWF